MGIIITKVVECDHNDCDNMLKLHPLEMQENHVLLHKGWGVENLEKGDIKTFCPEHKKERKENVL